MNNIKLKNDNIILKQMGIKTKNLWDSDFQKELFLKELYKLAKNNNFSKEHFEFITSKLGISMNTYITLLNDYIVKLPMEARPNISFVNGKYIVKIKEKSKLEKFYDKLSTLKKLYDIELFFMHNSVYEKMIIANYHRFKELYSSEDYSTIVNNILCHIQEQKRKKMESQKEEIYKEYEVSEKLHIGRPYFNKREKPVEPVKSNEEIKKEQNEKINEAIKIVELVTNDNTYHIMHLLKEHGVERNSFKKKLELVKHNNQALYKKFIGKRTRIINAVIKEMNASQEENRKFDIIDYQTITDVEPSDLAYYTSGSKSLSLKKFASANFLSFRDEDNYKEKIKKEKIIFNIELDKNNNYIEGTGRELSDEEKENFIHFLEYSKMYVNQFTFLALKNRFRKGIITKSQDKKLVIKPLK